MKKQSTVRQYYRLAKPGIIYGNILTATGGFLFASKGTVDIWLLVATVSGTALVIASGCIFNNYLDRNIDKKMARTHNRALATGRIPVQKAMAYSIISGLLGLGVLAFWTNFLVLGIGVAAWIFYVIFYGFTKRRSVHGTLIGTIPGAASMVAGYVAAANRFDLGAFLLFLVMVFWQMPHFYAIALYRYRDYKAAGLPVLPVKKGLDTTRTQIILYITGFIGAIWLLVFYGYAGIGFAVVMLVLSLRWLQLGLDNFDNTANAERWGRKMFLFSLIVIASLSFMLAANAWIPGQILYTLSMLVLIHVIIALSSLMYSTYLFISPVKSRFLMAYVLIAMTLASGTYLVISSGANMLQACTTGLLYLGFVFAAIIAAYKKLSRAL